MAAASFAALFVAHQVADHWVQTDKQACRKGAPGWPGRLACTAHVATYTVTAVLFVLPVVTVLGVHTSVGRLAAGLALSAATHWLIDRRWLLVWLADRTGSRAFVRMGACRPGHDDNPSLGTGAYALDQSAHYVFLFLAALLAVA
jgi:hypothetical protein